jgi:cell division protein FtsL
MWKVYTQTTDDRQTTDRRTTDKKRSEKLTWAFSSGELKITLLIDAFLLYMAMGIVFYYMQLSIVDKSGQSWPCWLQDSWLIKLNLSIPRVPKVFYTKRTYIHIYIYIYIVWASFGPHLTWFHGNNHLIHFHWIHICGKILKIIIQWWFLHFKIVFLWAIMIL